MDNIDVNTIDLINHEKKLKRRQRSVSPASVIREKDEKDEKSSRCEKINKIIQEYFLDHPQQVKMTYFQHFKRAMGMAIQTGMATTALLVHSIVPKFFPYTGSSIIKQLNQQIVEHTATTNK